MSKLEAMKNPACFILAISILASCESPMEKPLSKQPIVKDSPKPLPKQLIANDTTIPTVDNKEPPQYKPKTHLHDTTYVEGSFILFLCPDDSRYAELESISEDVGTGDSDFGIGISNTLDSLKQNPQYSNIKGLVSTHRYINIKDCIGGPLVIDRDTVNYGFIMSAKGKHIDSDLNSVHSGHYCGEIDSYFFGKGI
jgi:hypothetical protein